MEIGKRIKIGRMGQQPMQIVDQSVAPEHAVLKRLSDTDYQIEEINPAYTITVCGLFVKRKTIKETTPLLLGQYSTTVKEMLTDFNSINLGQVWKEYEKQKAKWDRYTNLANSIARLTPVVTTVLAQLIGNNWIFTVGVLLVMAVISVLVSMEVNARKNKSFAELNKKLQDEYVCPHCHRFLGFTPYSYLKSKRYCPNTQCGKPLP